MKVVQHPITIVIFTLLCAALVISLRQGENKIERSTEEISSLEEQAYSLSLEVQDLQEELEYSKSPEYKEKIIRNELLMQKENEYIVQLSLPETSKENSTKIIENKESTQEKWLQILF